MKIALLFLGVAFSLPTLLLAQPGNNTPEMQEAMKALGLLLGGGTNTASSSSGVIHHRQLKALLPAEFAGMKRTNSEAGKQSAMGMNISYANAEYSSDDASAEAKISDISAMGEFMKMAQYAWANTELEQENDSGYEKTVQVDGFPAKESFTFDGKIGHLEIMIDGRLMVDLQGYGLEMEQLVNLAKVIDLKRLAGLQPATE